MLAMNHNNAKRISVSEIEAEIHKIGRKWPDMPPVTVINSVSELPFEAPFNSDGIHCDGKVYLIAENIETLKQVQKVMAHECILHFGLEDMLGNYGFAKLHSGIQALKAAKDPTVTALAADILKRYGELSPEEETKEIVAKAGELCLDKFGNVKPAFGFMKSVFANVANWLRDKGVSFPFTNTELQGIICNAGNWIQRTRGNEAIEKSGAFSGQIVDVLASGIIIQKIGRNGETARHALDNLTAKVLPGDVVNIQYKNGVGIVCAKTFEKGLFR